MGEWRNAWENNFVQKLSGLGIFSIAENLLKYISNNISTENEILFALIKLLIDEWMIGNKNTFFNLIFQSYVLAIEEFCRAKYETDVLHYLYRN